MNCGIKSLWLLILLLIVTSINVLAQGDTLFVEKSECLFMNKYKGSKLVLHYKDDTLQKESFTYGYDLEYFIKLSDDKKLLLIENLLRYENDTALCCLDVIGHSFNGIEGCRGVPKSKRYTIQIDALYMINRLCWPGLMEFYSCYNVLYDTKTDKEINSDPSKIECVFKEYKKWYEECKAIGRIPKYFPFNDGRYVWYGGRKSGVLKDY